MAAFRGAACALALLAACGGAGAVPLAPLFQNLVGPDPVSTVVGTPSEFLNAMANSSVQVASFAGKCTRPPPPWGLGQRARAAGAGGGVRAR